ncbi:MAG: hypothetical protein ACI30H_05770 [Paludibacteraceae bacterium]
MKKHLFLFIPLLAFVCALLNYRGAQYDIEYDTWWEQAHHLQQSVINLVCPSTVPAPWTELTDCFGRTYCDSEWHYYDRDDNLHFNFSRLIVLAFWYAYVFIGPWVLIWLIYKQITPKDHK